MKKYFGAEITKKKARETMRKNFMQPKHGGLKVRHIEKNILYANDA